MRVGDGVHDAPSERDCAAGAAGGEAGTDSGIWRDTAAATAVGQSAALKLLLTGEMIGAAEALRIGLVDEVVPPEKLMERAEALAKAIVAMAPLAIAGCMEAVRWGSELGLDAALDVEAEIFGRLCGTDDKAEGTKAFLEKRPAVWTGQ